MAEPDGIFFDEKEMLAMGWPFGVVQMLRRVFESDAVNLQAEIDANSGSATKLLPLHPQQHNQSRFWACCQ